MQKRILPIAIVAIIFISLFSWNCTKLDTTDLGSDLLPVVDNVNTFADTLPILSTQGVFLPDSTYILRTDDHAFGINNDPVFGQTTASIAFQLKPNFYPYFIGGAGDTLNWPGGSTGAGLDSVVLCLKYKGFYGDSSLPVEVDVREVTDNPPYLFRDSTNKYRNVNFMPGLGNIVGGATIDVRRLGDTVKYKYGNGYTVNTIRIKLSTAYATALYNRDTIYNNPTKNAFATDSLFRKFYNGLAVVPTSGNQLIYTDLADVDTKLEIHFRRKNGGRIDTLVNSLVLNADFLGSPLFRSSSTANYITRSRPALPSGDQEIYLQTNPGTFASLNIPAISTLSNRIVHRAELVVQEIPDNSGTADKFKAPNYLYIDIKDSGTTGKWKTVYYDLNPGLPYDPDYKNSALINYFPNEVDFVYFGGFIRNKTDVFGNPAHFYNFNITRYLQDVITNHKNNAEIRLYAPFNVLYPQYSPFPITYGNNIAYGRVKVGGGNNPNYRMYLRMVYSKL